MKALIASVVLLVLAGQAQAQIVNPYSNPVALNFVFELPTTAQANANGFSQDTTLLYNLGDRCRLGDSGSFRSQNCWQVPYGANGERVQIPIRAIGWSCAVQGSSGNHSMMVAVIAHRSYGIVNLPLEQEQLFPPLQLQRNDHTCHGSITVPMPTLWSGDLIQVVPFWRYKASTTGEPLLFFIGLTFHK